PQADDCLADYLRLRVLGDAADEALVQLEDVQRKALEIAEGGEAGAEIVQRQAHAELGQLAQAGKDLRGVLHQLRLGDLKNQIGRGQATVLQYLGDQRREVAALQLANR